MIGKLILTAIILGGGAFMLLSDDFLEFITPYAGAAATDIENMKNDPATQAKFNNALEIIYEKLDDVKFSFSDLIKNNFSL